MNSTPPRLTTAVATLISAGFALESVERNPGYAVLLLSRRDEFGTRQAYAFAVAEDRLLTATHVEAARITANHHGATLVAVGETTAAVPTVPWDRFINLFGGPVSSQSPWETDFGGHLIELGHNRLPAGLSGRPDDLFEIHVRLALEFILAGRVIRYGQERRFETRPDGIALVDERFRALYDAKAYSSGYPVTADSVRQFKSYVDDFSKRYQAFLPRLNAFIVISGTFEQRDATLGDRSREFLAASGIPLSCMRAETLAAAVALGTQYPAARRSINWGRVFADPVVDQRRIADEFEAVRRDLIVPGA